MTSAFKVKNQGHSGNSIINIQGYKEHRKNEYIDGIKKQIQSGNIY